MAEGSTPKKAEVKDLLTDSVENEQEHFEEALLNTSEDEFPAIQEAVKTASDKEKERLAAATKAVEAKGEVTENIRDDLANLRELMSKKEEPMEEVKKDEKKPDESSGNDTAEEVKNDAIDTSEKTEKTIATLTQQSSGFGKTVDMFIEKGITMIGPMLSRIPFLKNIPGFSNMDPEGLRQMAWNFLSKKPLGIPFVGGAVHALAQGKAELASKQTLVAAEAKKLGVPVQIAPTGAEELLRLKDSAIGDAVKTVVEAIAKTNPITGPVMLTAQMLLDAPKMKQQAEQAEQQELLAAKQERLDEIKDATEEKTGKKISEFTFGSQAMSIKNGEEYAISMKGSTEKFDEEDNRILTELLAQIGDEQRVNQITVSESPIRTLTKNGDSFALQISANGKSDVPELLASKDLMEKFALQTIQIGTDGTKRPLPPESFEVTQDGTLIVSKAEELPKIRTDNVSEQIASADGAGVYKLKDKQWMSLEQIAKLEAKPAENSVAKTDTKDTEESAEKVA